MTCQTFRAAGQFVILPRVPLFIQVLNTPVIVIYFAKCLSLQQISEASHIRAQNGALSNYGQLYVDSCLNSCGKYHSVCLYSTVPHCTFTFFYQHAYYLAQCLEKIKVMEENSL